MEIQREKIMTSMDRIIEKFLKMRRNMDTLIEMLKENKESIGAFVNAATYLDQSTVPSSV